MESAAGTAAVDRNGYGWILGAHIIVLSTGKRNGFLSTTDESSSLSPLPFFTPCAYYHKTHPQSFTITITCLDLTLKDIDLSLAAVCLANRTIQKSSIRCGEKRRRCLCWASLGLAGLIGVKIFFLCLSLFPIIRIAFARGVMGSGDLFKTLWAWDRSMELFFYLFGVCDGECGGRTAYMMVSFWRRHGDGV